MMETTSQSPDTLLPSKGTQNDLTIFFNQEQFHIIKQYRRLHRFLFKYGVFVLMIILGAVGLYLLLAFGATDSQLTYKHPSPLLNTLVEEAKIPAPQVDNLDLTIPYGVLSLDKGEFMSVSNL
ncbi:MAG: hypothetical protein LBP53_04110 [Candidatus Peribacteria bacterium]|jgi:hypothetical protein|nr:hypothetical protein [Candidatus Peribacteria bacterium]